MFRYAAISMRFLAAILVCLSLTSLVTIARAGTPVKVLVPDNDNLQYMSFWIAKAAGYFEQEGLEISLVTPPSPQQTLPFFLQSKADVAVLPPPVYLQLISQKFAFVLVANLLKNDPINLIVRRSVLSDRNVSLTASVGERLRAIRGLRVGVAPNPPKRLRALFTSQGLDADNDIAMVVFHGREQNAAFAEKRVDALYAHTPYLEAAIVDQDAVVLVNQSAGDVAQLASRQIHALAVTRQYRDGNAPLVAGMTRAIARAERLVHSDPAAVVAALAAEFPKMNRRHIETIVSLYAPAIPDTPVVSVDGLLPALALFPASQTAPDLTGIDLAPYIDAHFAQQASAPARAWASSLIVGASALALAAGVVLVAARRRRAARPGQA